MIESISNLPKERKRSFSLDELAKMGVKKILLKALTPEVQEYLNGNAKSKGNNGYRLVV